MCIWCICVCMCMYVVERKCKVPVRGCTQTSSWDYSIARYEGIHTYTHTYTYAYTHSYHIHTQYVVVVVILRCDKRVIYSCCTKDDTSLRRFVYTYIWLWSKLYHRYISNHIHTYNTYIHNPRFVVRFVVRCVCVCLSCRLSSSNDTMFVGFYFALWPTNAHHYRECLLSRWWSSSKSHKVGLLLLLRIFKYIHTYTHTCVRLGFLMIFLFLSIYFSLSLSLSCSLCMYRQFQVTFCRPVPELNIFAVKLLRLYTALRDSYCQKRAILWISMLLIHTYTYTYTHTHTHICMYVFEYA